MNGEVMWMGKRDWGKDKLSVKEEEIPEMVGQLLYSCELREVL